MGSNRIKNGLKITLETLNRSRIESVFSHCLLNHDRDDAGWSNFGKGLNQIWVGWPVSKLDIGWIGVEIDFEESRSKFASKVDPQFGFSLQIWYH